MNTANRITICRSSIIFLALSVGLTVFFGLSGVSLALQKKFDPSKTYCGCQCTGAHDHADLYWEKVGACSGANGKACSFNSSIEGGNLVPGKLSNCMECKADASGGLLCGGRSIAPGTVLPIPPPGGMQRK